MSMTRIQQNVAFKDETNSEKQPYLLAARLDNVLVIIWKVDCDVLDSVKVNGVLIGEISDSS